MLLEAVKGTVLLSDARWLRDTGRYAAYADALGRRAAALAGVTASEWVGVELVRAHFSALDSLGISGAEAHRAGIVIGEAVQGAFLRTATRLAAKAGATPWLPLSLVEKAWTRSMRGGRTTMEKLAERQARITVTEAPVLTASNFWCASLSGATAAGIRAFCARPLVEVDAHDAERCVLSLAW